MKQQDHKHLRRLSRVWIDDPIYFVIACTHSRSRKLASDPVADILVDEWKTAATKHGWLVGRYVIMPDHVHFFCAAPPNARSLSEFVRLWKQWTTKRIVAAVGNRGYSARLAARVFRSRLEVERKLCTEVVVRARESGPSGSGDLCG